MSNHEHEWGAVEHAWMTGTPHRKCTVEGCKFVSFVSLDLDDDYFEGLNEVDKSPQEIASAWHGGQSSQLYSFASTGKVFNKVALTAEIQDEIDASNAWTHSNDDLYQSNVTELETLLAYVEQAEEE